MNHIKEIPRRGIWRMLKHLSCTELPQKLVRTYRPHKGFWMYGSTEIFFCCWAFTSSLCQVWRDHRYGFAAWIYLVFKCTSQLFIYQSFTSAEPAVWLWLPEDFLDLSLPCPKGYSKAGLTFSKERILNEENIIRLWGPSPWCRITSLNLKQKSKSP